MVGVAVVVVGWGGWVVGVAEVEGVIGCTVGLGGEGREEPVGWGSEVEDAEQLCEVVEEGRGLHGSSGTRCGRRAGG